MAIVFVSYITWEIVGEAPAGLTTLLGVAGGAWFGAMSDDKKKRDAEVSDTAHRTEVTADRIEAKLDAGEARHDAAEIRADASEDRETGWSQHKDHDDDVVGGP
jgi:hypothetical protein